MRDVLEAVCFVKFPAVHLPGKVLGGTTTMERFPKNDFAVVHGKSVRVGKGGGWSGGVNDRGELPENVRPSLRITGAVCEN